ncbi:MAG: hypothetical protein ACXVAY_02555 [Mucilaginibacter sp.]
MKKKHLPFIILVGLLALSSCKKNSTDIVIDPKILSSLPSIQLKVDNIINDSTIVLKWTKLNNKGFVSYSLYRSGTFLVNGKIVSGSTLLKTFTSADSLQYTENKMPFGRSVNYSIYAATDSLKNNASAYVTYTRPNALYQQGLYDVLINDQKKYLYVYDQTGHILIIDYARNKQITSTDLKVNIGFCALGDYNGSENELYVPTADGWLDILDASTLAVKDRIYVTGGAIASVVANNGQLYVSSSDATLTITGYDNQMKIYDRQSKNVISRTGFWNYTRLLYLQGTNTEVVDLTTNLAPAQLGYYKFDGNGVLQTKTKDPYFAVYNYDFNIFRSFPDGSKFITGASGFIFNKNLIFDRTLNTNASYLDFAFNSDGSIIYAAGGTLNGAQNAIQAISYPSLGVIKSYPTVLVPFKIFRDGNSLIVISTNGAYHPSTYYTPTSVYFMLEKINL